MTEEEIKAKLTPEQYEILRQGGTEVPFTGKYVNEHAKGMYQCAVCGHSLFSSEAKFDSGTGWPSFTDPVNLENVELVQDDKLGMRRTEVRCKRCGSHLGHVFDDLPETYRSGRSGGPEDKDGKRYCINSLCLELSKE